MKSIFIFCAIPRLCAVVRTFFKLTRKMMRFVDSSNTVTQSVALSSEYERNSSHTDLKDATKATLLLKSQSVSPNRRTVQVTGSLLRTISEKSNSSIGKFVTQYFLSSSEIFVDLIVAFHTRVPCERNLNDYTPFFVIIESHRSKLC